MSVDPALNGGPPPAETERNERLARLLLEVARTIEPQVAAVLPRQVELDSQMEALRTVLMRRELDVLDHLEETIDDPEHLAEAVSEILPHAVELSEARGGRLGEALAPTVERATQSSIRDHPGTLVNILYPVIGPAIRKSIAESLGNTLQGLNQALRYAFSLRGVKWRLEAMRSGTTFGDVVLKHTLVFRVEHLFLIHRQSGLLLEHQAAPDAVSQDPQLVSGMLTAIQDFVRDSLDDSGTSETGAIDSLRLGDLLIWCEAGPQAYLAAVIRGTPPETLREGLRDSLDRIHKELRAELEDYDGDDSCLGDLAVRLEPCLKQQEQRHQHRYKPLLWLIPLALLGVLVYGQIERRMESQRVHGYVDRLRAEPGIVVTMAERREGSWYIEGLRDPLAADPEALRQAVDLGPAVIHEAWEPYAALSPGIVLKRIQASLPPLASVQMRLDGSVIRVEGGVPRNWADKAQALVASLPAGAPTIDLSGLTDVADAEYVRLRDAIQSAVIYFETNAPDPAPGQEAVLDGIAASMHAIMDVAQRLGFAVRLSIQGRADSTGRQTTNLAISSARAEVVRSLLRSRGIAPDMMTVRGTGTLEPLAAGETAGDQSLNRSVTFTVTTSE